MREDCHDGYPPAFLVKQQIVMKIRWVTFAKYLLTLSLMLSPCVGYASMQSCEEHEEPEDPYETIDHRRMVANVFIMLEEIADGISTEELTSDDTLYDAFQYLGLDSLHLIELSRLIEDSFEVEVDFFEIVRRFHTTISDFSYYLMSVINYQPVPIL